MRAALDAFRQDLRYALRAFRRSTGFSLLAIATIAIGVGATAAVFSVVNALLLRPLPYPRASELVLVAQANKQTKQSYGSASPANFLDWRVRAHAFTAMSAYRETSFTIAGRDRPDRVNGAMTSANFFDVLEVKPAVGRAFVGADEEPGAPRILVLGNALWRQRFGGRPDAIGQTVRLNDEPYTIVGVMPPGVDYPSKADLWVVPHYRVPDDPLRPAQDPSSQRAHGYFSVVARLKPGVTFESAVADMDAVATSLEHDYPNDDQNIAIGLVRLRDDLVADVRATVLLLFGAVALVLLIATANVSGLLIARSTARHQEIAVRVALGASRRRILAQLLTESVLLAAAGGAAGVVLATWLVAPLVKLSPSDLAVVGDITVDMDVLLFGLLTSTAAGLFFGLAPARQLTRLDVHNDLKQSARGGSAGGQRHVRSILVVGEIALSVVLVVAAGLTIRSFNRLQHVPTGFAADDVFTVTVSLPAARYSTPEQRAGFWQRVLDSLRTTPGIQSIGATSRLPLLPGNSTRGLAIPNQPPNVQTVANYRTASPDYFRTLGIPILRGRPFDDADREGRPFVAIITSSAAKRFWPDRDPVGERFQINVPGPEYTIVGIAGDVRSASLEAAPLPTVYVPYRQDPWPFMTIVMRTSLAPAAVTSAVQSAIWRVDKDQPTGAIRTMDEQLSRSLTRRRFSVTLFSAFGATAVVLAAVGLYGVLAFIVAERRREIGVRIALGATPRTVVAGVMGQGLRLAAVGVVVGVLAALGTSRLLQSLLFGTSATDAATFAAVATFVIAIAAAASALPALRASRVDPLVALRDE